LDDGTAKPLVVVIWISLFAAVGIGQLMLRRPRARSPQAIG
jgi:hypothetical protein